VIQAYFDDLARGIEAKLAADPDAASPRKAMALSVARLGRSLFDPEETVVLGGVLAPFELFHALGLRSCFAEFIGAMLSSIRAAQPSLERAEAEGYAQDSCSYHRAVMGAALQGLMPPPAFCVATSTPCAGGLAVVEALARHFQTELFVLHVPQRDDPESAAYLAGQLRDLAGFVAAQTGRELDPERLRASVELANEARALLVQVGRLASHVPTPAKPREMNNMGFVASLLFGSEDGVYLARTVRDIYSARVVAGEQGVPGERRRLLWVQNRIQFRSGLEEHLAEQHQAAIVFDELNEPWWEPIDPDDPFTALALRMIQNPLNGPVGRRVDRLVQNARAYKVDGAIQPCHFGCRQGTGARGLITSGLREAGIPSLSLEIDCVDERNWAPGQVRTRVDAFLEMLPARTLVPDA
jgi:benzoyl-CoA reductase/2-hydroxyglutaryl-CoA dehydratase subunit BcrC/BadD/HgdB